MAVLESDENLLIMSSQVSGFSIDKQDWGKASYIMV